MGDSHADIPPNAEAAGGEGVAPSKAPGITALSGAARDGLAANVHRRVMLTAGLLVGLDAIYITWFLRLGWKIGGVGQVVGGIIGTAGLYDYMLRRSAVGRHMMVGGVYFCLLLVQMEIGPVNGGAGGAWLILPPLMGAAFGGLRDTWIWAGIALTTLLVLAVLQYMGVVPLTVLSPEMMAEHATFDHYGLVLVSIGLMLVLVYTRSRAERELDQALEAVQGVAVELETEVAARTDAERVARSVAEQRSRFLATMSHEIRTPMNGIVGMADLLLQDEHEPQTQEAIRLIKTSGDALMSIVDDVLHLAKIDSGALELEQVPFDVSELVTDAVRLMQARAARSGIALYCRIDSALKPERVGDPARLRQILLNLLSNAVKFTERGYVALEVSALSADELLFSVVDTGVGMSADQQARIFEPFRQADVSTTRRFGGTGLGLTICRRLADLMGATLTVESRAGHGSTFSLQVTVAENTEAPPLDRVDTTVLVVCPDSRRRDEICNQVVAVASRVEALASGEAVLKRLERGTGQAGTDVRTLIMCDKSPEWAAVLCQRAQELDIQTVQVRTTLMLPPLNEAPAQTTLHCPVRRAELAECLRGAPRTEGVQSARPKLPASKERARVLLVDDNTTNLKVGQAMLTRLGVDCTVVESGYDALEHMKAGGYELVLLDCEMPGMDGYETTRRWRVLEAGWGTRLPIVALTANTTAAQRDASLASGMDDHMNKPLRLATLQATLQEWLPAELPVHLASRKRPGRGG